MEIERKFLVKSLPQDLENYPSKKIKQGYLCTNPVIRIRQSNDDYYLTYKGKGFMVREEHEFPLTKEAFEHMLPKTDDNTIEKTRYLIPLDDFLTVHLDIFEGRLAPLQLAEVEFDSKAAATYFQPPEWFGEEVTNRVEYLNSTLSKTAP